MMVYGGVSLKGKNHDINQDSYKVHYENGFIAVVVSDGVGSKPNSERGSELFCDILISEAKKCSMAEIQSIAFLERIQKKWQNELNTDNINDYCCTALFCIVKEKTAYLAQLGDGIVGVASHDDTVILFDDKMCNFLNETYCLSNHIDLDNWKTCTCNVGESFGIVLCTDGVEIFPPASETYKEFVMDIYESYAAMDVNEIQNDMKKWLNDILCQDDKTIAFFFSMEGENEIEDFAD